MRSATSAVDTRLPVQDGPVIPTEDGSGAVSVESLEPSFQNIIGQGTEGVFFF